MRTLYIPPDPPLDHIGNHGWTRAQAREYFEWFSATKSRRVESLLSFLGIAPTLTGEQRLDALEAALVTVVQRDSTFVMHGTTLTRTGMLLQLDVGAVYGDELLRQPSNARWMIDLSSRSSASFGRPVIGPSALLEFIDPINKAGVFILEAAEGQKGVLAACLARDRTYLT